MIGAVSAFVALRGTLRLRINTIIYCAVLLWIMYLLVSSGAFDLVTARFALMNSSADDLMLATSGRYGTWSFIYSEFSSAGLREKLIGQGLGSMARAAASGYEFPHLDALLILHEVGVLGLALYVLCVIALIKRYSVAVVFFVLAHGFHTNFSFFMGLLVFVPLMYSRECIPTANSSKVTVIQKRIS